MNKNIPDFILHYSRDEPFRSITNVAPHQLEVVINGLNEKNTWGINRFSDLTYLMQRLEVEKIMHAQFIENGGKPELSNPVYFFLGSNIRFEEHPLNVAYAIKLSKLNKNQISFSYGDTMLSFNEENRKQSGERYNNPLCNKIFMLDELNSLFDNKSFPNENALAVEAHLWIHPAAQMVQKLAR